jgi:predicted Rossmann fold flavoprotein
LFSLPAGLLFHYPAAMIYDVMIIGGGAAGMFAAAVLAERAPDWRILVLEKGPKPLAKVRVSGGGRCNLTHACSDIRTFSLNYPRGQRELIGPLHRFGPAECMAWFEEHGLPLVTLEDGCVFPRSDTSLDVINALLSTTRNGQVDVRTSVTALHLRAVEAGYAVSIGTHDRVTGRCVLIATGGGSFIEGIDHTIEPCVPSLFAFNSSDRAFTALAGMVIKTAQLSGPDGIRSDGELLITHTGVSGPAVLRLSSFGARGLAEAGYRFTIRINWLAGQHEEQVYERLLAHKNSSPRQQIGTWSPLGLPARLWRLLLQRANANAITEWGGCPLTTIRRIANQITGFSLPISGKNRHREEFVTCGGVRLKEVNFKTMESRLHPGLYLAGEVLDIDALTGGYNLQAAWTTAYIAAHAILAQPHA